MGRGTLGLAVWPDGTGVRTQWVAGRLHLSFTPSQAHPVRSDHPQEDTRGWGGGGTARSPGRLASVWSLCGLMHHSENKTSVSPLKTSEENRREGDWDVQLLCPQARSCVSSEQQPSHRGLQQSPLLWAPGRDSEDRQTDSAGPLEPSAARSGRCSGQCGGSTMYMAACGEGPLSDALLHRVHGDVVVVAAHGQVRLQEGAESRQ